ncbi:lipoate--protein ligase family protein [Candidatus Woesearchaeota archaeon]|nr:lipoate--protein ligase family protein [Candidatus Woesearchaeota archaeon]
MHWRFIPLSTQTAALNMAIDEAILTAIADGKSPPTLRIYQWKPSAVSIGCFQGMQEEVDISKCKAAGVHCVRRITGGGAVYHDYDGELTYSILAPEALFPKDITQSYHLICGWIVDALALIGLEAAFKPINDVIVQGKKISGNAQTRRRGVVLQHGTILYTVDVAKMFSLLKVPNEKIRDKMIATVQERVTSVSNVAPKISKEELYHALREGFLTGKSYTPGTLSVDELTHAKRLVQERYQNDNWNFSR